MPSEKVDALIWLQCTKNHVDEIVNLITQIRSNENETDFTDGSYQHLIADQYDLSIANSPGINEHRL
ncbi:hypothetical protein PHET_04254 [Paragonimus heterotremus]|uniref:Uncharacterized protein n=1 Tax=Paragonimus heterotremus TaxID=100268 RepID=A0A8J4SZU4_9TREM|nr:hypothetical protein PHET_04254 [Paragonimus heterotremus]